MKIVMSKRRILSGMRPTGKLHLGHWVGALENWTLLQGEYENFHLIADWHALTTAYDRTAELKENCFQMVLDWLAAGINPEISPIFIQSQVPQHAELHLIFSMLVTMARLERNPAVKEQAKALNLESTMSYGHLGYPVLQAADILLYNPQNELLEYSAGLGFRSSVIKTCRIHANKSYAGQAISEGNIFHISSREAIVSDSRLAGFWDAEGFSQYFCARLVAKEKTRGVLEVYLHQPLKPDVEWINFLETLAGQAAIAIDNAQLLENLQRANEELILAYDSTLVGWVDYLDLRDRETQNHTQRVTHLTLQLAEAMGIDGPALVHIRRGALLHDIGKIGIPDGILRKAGPLTDKEWEIMRRHPDYANNFLSKIDYLRPALDIPYYHHEKWDGSGYPSKLKGEQIPLAARIFAVVDVWDALSSDRPYRKGWEKEKVLEYIRSQSGSHFDPAIVEQFLQVVTESDETGRG